MAALVAIAALSLGVFLSSSAAAPSESGNSGLDGFWVSDGYGFLFEIHGRKMRLSLTTVHSCAPVAVARRTANTPPGAEAAFVVDKKRSLPVLDVDSGLLTISAGRKRDVKRLRVDGAISDIVLARAVAEPPTCAKRHNTPLHNFDVFWETFREQYPFFALKGVDWDAMRSRFRSRITNSTTPAQLFAIFVEMIKPLEDAHTSVELESKDLDFTGERPDPQPLRDADFKRVTKIIDSQLVQKRRSFANGHVSFGRLPHGIGYLRLTSFSEYTDSGRISEALVELDRALDVAFAGPMAGLVIDVRVNDGGSDVLGVAIASRLTRKAYTAYAKAARNDAVDPHAFTTPQVITVAPSTDTRFDGPIAVLTSRYSVSAAETFTQALLGRPGDACSSVVRIGENTQGVFSDVLLRTLPNTIAFELPNEVYTTDGKSFDQVGIAPHIRTGLVFKRSNLSAGHDPELDAAMKALTSKHRCPGDPVSDSAPGQGPTSR